MLSIAEIEREVSRANELIALAKLEVSKAKERVAELIYNRERMIHEIRKAQCNENQ